ncbi:MAG TPA: dihydropteroate synthase, partial [Stellaceae bacterium]|nr:dihydropteroate synthase [Stellaceae bacterium]
ILMHRQGTSATMQRDPHYELASLDVLEALEARVEACAAAGIERDRILIDPGIGFGKHAAHNLEILARLGLLHGLGCGVMVGLSRKSLVGHLTQVVPPKERLPGSLAGGLFSVASGAQWLRVHDVAATRQVLLVWRAASFGA